MNYFHALVTVSFAVLALFHAAHPAPLLWVPYAAGAGLAALTLLPNLGIIVARLLALAATGLMFFFFAGFFTEVPRLDADWYQSQEGWSVVAMLVGAFTLIPVLSVYSCRCKADCGRHRGEKHRGFFTVPDQLPPRSS